MTITEQLQKVTEALRMLNTTTRAQFNAIPAASEKMNFSDYKLPDGTILRIDGEVAVGALIYVVNGEEILPAPDGVHEVEELGKITTQGGKIVAIEPAVVAPNIPAAAAIAANDMPGVMPENEDVVINQKLDALNAKLDTIIEALGATMGGYATATENTMGQFAALNSKIEELLAQPTAEAKPNNRAAGIAAGIIETKNARLKELTQIIKKSK